MMTAFRVILLICLVLSFVGGVAGNREEQRNCKFLFIASSALFLMSFLT